MHNTNVEHEKSLQRAVTVYIVTGLLFMLLPGTFLGVLNLISISNRQQLDSLSTAWIQAHGHAQIYGWIGTFILGIGFYSLSKMGNRFAGHGARTYSGPPASDCAGCRTSRDGNGVSFFRFPPCSNLPDF